MRRDESGTSTSFREAIPSASSSRRSARPVPRKRVVVAEDDARMRALIVGLLRRHGAEVIEFDSGGRFLSWADQSVEDRGAVSLVITDVHMPGGNGLHAVATLRERGVEVPVIVITAFGDEETHTEAKNVGADFVFDKPFEISDLRAAVAELI